MFNPDVILKIKMAAKIGKIQLGIHPEKFIFWSNLAMCQISRFFFQKVHNSPKIVTYLPCYYINKIIPWLSCVSLAFNKTRVLPRQNKTIKTINIGTVNSAGEHSAPNGEAVSQIPLCLPRQQLMAHS